MKGYILTFLIAYIRDFASEHCIDAEGGGADAQVSSGDTLCRQLNLIGTRGSFFSSGLTRTDFTFISFHETGGDKVLPADII